MIVLTGGTGLVGGEWLRLLPPDTVVLTRRPELVSRTAAVCADLRLPVNIEGSRVEYILHCAADIRFHAPFAESWAANVTATENLLRFARRCPHLRKFVFVSSVYACGDTEGVIYETPINPAPNFFSNYERTKFAAEQLVLDAMGDLPVQVIRLSSIIGSRLGEVRQANYFHQLLRLAALDVLPVIPARWDALADVIPVDWAVEAMHHLLASNAVGVFHVCAGPDRAITLERLSDLLGLNLPRFAPVNECDEFYGSIGGRRAEVWKKVRSYLPHLALRQEFDMTRCSRALTGSGIEWLSSEELISRVVCGSVFA